MKNHFAKIKNLTNRILKNNDRILKRILIAISFITLFSCQQQSNKASEVKNISQTKSAQKKYPQVDTSKVLISDIYYQFVRLTDSTSSIKWGNKSISNAFNDTVSNFFLEKDRINLKWSNNKFISLGRSSGSDTWLNIILPLTKGGNAKTYENPLTVDKDNGIVVCEYSFNKSDTVLIAENVITGKRQIIGTDWKKCSSAFNHYCIDSISISKKQLYVEWTLPNTIDKPNKTEIKRIRLDL